ncbi:peptidoglycan editing factor PgeF [Rhabdochlamydiaceae symbiont of Dictyostelium giganteum]|uniref:peptidoglycan editing factor PgeF n=1 Tax=Rhabdochlamydiaceae symbiont of Dictyostelium giganteum TaxID=3342349 RepID=UPI00385128FE
MLYHQKEGLRWLIFEIFEPFQNLSHAVFLKEEKPLFPQEKENIMKTATPHDSLSSLHLVHGNMVIEAPVPALNIQADGMITQTLDAALTMSHADCQIAIFYDPIHHALGMAHAGWRGQVCGIYEKVIQKMQKMYGSLPQDLHVGISPSLGPCCAEFLHYQEEFPETFREFMVRPYYFDLWEIARWQLISHGILPSHLQVAKICTCCNPSHYFSYRRDHTSQRNRVKAVLTKTA